MRAASEFLDVPEVRERASALLSDAIVESGFHRFESRWRKFTGAREFLQCGRTKARRDQRYHGSSAVERKINRMARQFSRFHIRADERRFHDDERADVDAIAHQELSRATKHCQRHSLV